MERNEVEHNIWWQLKAGNSSFWFDNGTKEGALYYTKGDWTQEEEIEEKELILNGVWDVTKLRATISEEMVQHIVENINRKTLETCIDTTWWTQLVFLL